MLNKLDDYPVHQTSEPIAHPAASNPNIYDRTWFNGYSPDGDWYFGIGMAVYPLRGIIDCAFSVVERGGRQHCFFASGRAPDERTDMRIGPFRMEIIEPMKRCRVVIDDNETGISCDLTFSTRTAAMEESLQRVCAPERPKVIMESTRFNLFGRWSGLVRHPDGEIKVTEENCFGTKDRSWGHRPVGGPLAKGGAGEAPLRPEGYFFLWAPLFWEDHVSHALVFENEEGHSFFREGITVPLYGSEADVPGYGTGRENEQRTTNIEHRIRYEQGTRFTASAEIDMIFLGGEVRTISFEPILRFHMKGLGYGHPVWAQGQWQGELAIHGESFYSSELDPLKRENVHVQQVVKVTDGVRTGIGVLEQGPVGPYKPHGFTEWLK